MLKLKPIEVEDYPNERDRIITLVDKIWTRKESAEQARHSIERWDTAEESETGKYFYILKKGESVGITGYFIPDEERGLFGLRHHGVTQKGTGKRSFELLVDYLIGEYGKNFIAMIELIPEGREELIDRFRDWGFELRSEGVPDWEPKKDYYDYAMVRKIKKERD